MKGSLFRPAFLFLGSLVLPIACALHEEDLGFIDESVDDCVRDGVVGEDLIEESISQCYPETVTVGWLELDTVSVLKQMDIVSWDLAEGEWIDAELSDDSLVTFDSGSTYFWTREVEEFLDKAEEDAA